MQLVKIEKDDTIYNKTLLELSNIVKKRNLLPFLGAGISIDPPASLPNANDLIKPLFKTVWESRKPFLINNYVERSEIRKARSVVKKARLERLLDVLYYNHGMKAIEYLGILSSPNWNKNHASLANIASRKLLPWCITLNFDLLIEKAFINENIGIKTICPLTNAQFVQGSPVVTNLIKPHGSFVPTSESSNKYKYISATLGQIGTYPNKKNSSIFINVINMCPVLLVAGYSDNDWDIFPILVNLSDLFSHIYWIEFKSKNDLKLPIDHLFRKTEQRITDWLQFMGKKATLIFGKSETILSNIASEVSNQKSIVLSYEKKEYTNLKTPNVSPLAGSIDFSNNNTILNILSLAMLIQHTGQFSVSLLKWLNKNDEIKENVKYKSLVEYLLAHTEHTKGRVDAAIIHMKNCIKTKRESISDDFLWLGYEYFCLAKYPRKKLLIWLFLVPIYLALGVIYFYKGIRISKTEKRNDTILKVKYYFADLLHSWGSFLLILGKRADFLIKPYFRLVNAIYSKIAENAAFMEEEYYWLRHLESKLLSRDKKVKIDKVRNKIGQLQSQYEILQENVQIGNIQVYQGLMSYIMGNKLEALEKLDMAKNIWNQVGDEISAGHKRVALFRKYFSDENIGTLKTLKKIFYNRN